MARTKWKNRTPEEQARIKAETEAKHGKKSDSFQKDFDKSANEIYLKYEIPLFCTRCMKNIVATQYVKGQVESPLTGKPAVTIAGQCPVCWKWCFKHVGGNLSMDELMVIPLIVSKLQMGGRITDEKEGELQRYFDKYLRGEWK